MPETAIDRPSHLDRITIDPAVCGGRPCIRSMRVRVSDVVDLMAGGASTADVLADFPDLDGADVGAALAAAADAVDHRVIRAA